MQGCYGEVKKKSAPNPRQLKIKSAPKPRHIPREFGKLFFKRDKI